VAARLWQGRVTKKKTQDRGSVRRAGRASGFRASAVTDEALRREISST
jgi:hypothetical protein